MLEPPFLPVTITLLDGKNHIQRFWESFILWSRRKEIRFTSQPAAKDTCCTFSHRFLDIVVCSYNHLWWFILEYNNVYVYYTYSFCLHVHSMEETVLRLAWSAASEIGHHHRHRLYPTHHCILDCRHKSIQSLYLHWISSSILEQEIRADLRLKSNH